jgi:hypothetical protein
MRTGETVVCQWQARREGTTCLAMNESLVNFPGKS